MTEQEFREQDTRLTTELARVPQSIRLIRSTIQHARLVREAVLRDRLPGPDRDSMIRSIDNKIDRFTREVNALEVRERKAKRERRDLRRAWKHRTTTTTTTL